MPPRQPSWHMSTFSHPSSANEVTFKPVTFYSIHSYILGFSKVTNVRIGSAAAVFHTLFKIRFLSLSHFSGKSYRLCPKKCPLQTTSDASHFSIRQNARGPSCFALPHSPYPSVSGECDAGSVSSCL